HWQVLGRAAQVAEPGAFVAAELFGAAVFAVRGHDGVLRAFHNACRHRASCVVTGDGRADELECPYHGWTYDLSGALRRAPRMAGVTGFDRHAHGLRPVAVETWGPYVLV